MGLRFERSSVNTINIFQGDLCIEYCSFMLTEDKKFLLQLNSIAYGDNGSVLINWHNDEVGEVSQKWSMLECEAEDTGYEFSIEVIPVNTFNGAVLFEFGFVPEAMPYFMIPGSLYGTNNIKDSKSWQPQLNYRGDINYPRTPVIRTRADRSTHNAVITVANNSVLGIRIDDSTWCGEKPYYNGLGIDTRSFDSKDRISLMMGYHHFPVRYIGKLGPQHSFTKESEYGWVCFEKGKSYTSKANLVWGPAENIFAYERVLKWFYNLIHQHPANKVDRYKAAKDISAALVNDAYNRSYKLFSTIYPDETGDISWTGGLQVAYPLICALKCYPEGMEAALDYIDNLVLNGFNKKTGLFYEAKTKDEWKVAGWWKGGVKLYDRNLQKINEFHSAYLNGQAVCYLLKSYRYMKAQAIEHGQLEQWLAVSKDIIDKVISSQRFDGALGVYFDSKNGEVVSYNGFQSAWFLAAISEMAAVTKDECYINAFRKAEGYYYAFMERVELWGTPMDTKDAVDEEGNLAYITALKTFHELTCEQRYLDHLIHALHYEFSWKFAYNTRHVNDPLKKLNWSSSGGSITSSHNIHIHQMGNLVSEEIYYAYKLTNDPYILNRLKDTLNWGLGTYNREDCYLGFGKKGWATEQFFHSDGVQDDINRPIDGGIWEDYLSWAASCVLLSSVADIPDEYYGL